MINDPVRNGRLKVTVHELAFTGLLTVSSHVRNQRIFYCFRSDSLNTDHAEHLKTRSWTW